MSLKYDISSFFQSSGNASALFGEQVRDAIATFSCNLWASYPDFITQGTNPASSFARGYMNQMCSPIQPAVPTPGLPFTGGQCVGARYTVRIRWVQNNGSLWRLLTFDVYGPISRILGFFEPNNPGIPNGAGLAKGEVDAFFQNGTPNTFLNDGSEAGPPDNAPTYEIVRTDGGIDNCGNPPIQYPVTNPTSIDLQTTINITNLDGVDNSYKLVYNKLSTNYNFPMGFKLNGVNVVLDLGGITIYGNPNITHPSSDNDVPPPGTDGGDDGVGGNNDEVFDDGDYPVIPDISIPETIDLIVDYLICEEGILQPISDTIKIISGNQFWLNIIIDIVVHILEETCGIEEAEATVGIPEYFGIKPGIDRPAIVYLYKEIINGKWDKSTYSSTVTHPSTASVADINTVTVPDKNMGTHYVRITLKDGSRISCTGDTEANAQSNFDFLINQVKSDMLPTGYPVGITRGVDERLQIKTVKCRQIEYYPDGKVAGTSPSIRRVIKLT